MKDEILSERETNIMTGKALVGALTKKDQLALVSHVNALYAKMDKMDLEDFFGTEGWRHFFGISGE